MTMITKQHDTSTRFSSRRILAILFMLVILSIGAAGCGKTNPTLPMQTSETPPAPSPELAKPDETVSAPYTPGPHPTAITLSPSSTEPATVSPTPVADEDDLSLIKSTPEAESEPTLTPIPITDVTPKEGKLDYTATIIQTKLPLIMEPFLHGDKLFFTGSATLNPGENANSLYLYDLKTKKMTHLATSHLGTDSGQICCLDASDDWLTWLSYDVRGGGNWRMYVKNLQTNEEVILDSEEATNVRVSRGAYIAISGDKAVWSSLKKLEDGSIHSFVFLYDLKTKKRTVLAETVMPESMGFVDIDGDLVTWTKGSNAHGKEKSDVFLYDLQYSRLSQVTNNGRSGQSRIEGHDMVWLEGFHDKKPIVIYNLDTGEYRRLKAYGYWPRLGDGLVLWSDNSGGTSIYDIRRNVLDTLLQSPHENYGSGAQISDRTVLLMRRPDDKTPEEGWSIEMRTYR